jgi:hypothetical protein
MQQVLNTTFYQLLFTNSANEVEDYGTWVNEQDARNKIASMQAEYGEEDFATQYWEIVTVTPA